VGEYQKDLIFDFFQKNILFKMIFFLVENLRLPFLFSVW